MDSEWFREFFDHAYYETYAPWQTEDVNRREAEFIARALELPPGSKLLDVGCGFARHAVHLAQMGYRVVCLDVSDYLLEKARERIKSFGVEDRVEIVKMDMRYMNFENEFDGAYIFFTTFGYFSDEENERVIENLARALKPRGSETYIERVKVESIWGDVGMNARFRYGMIVVLSLLTLAMGAIVMAMSSAVRPCHAHASDDGVVTFARAFALVTATHEGHVRTTVIDKYRDGMYVAARFIVRIDGARIQDVIYGVPDGGSITYGAGYYDVMDRISAEAQGILGVVDSDAIATAIYRAYCPLSESQSLLES